MLILSTAGAILFLTAVSRGIEKMIVRKHRRSGLLVGGKISSGEA